MTTHTLVANTGVSSLSLINGDSIALAGFTLNMDVVPTATGISVTSSGTAGKMTFPLSSNYTLSGWRMAAGSGPLIANVGSGTTIGGNIIAGSGNSAYGININSGIITGTITGGIGLNAYGVSTNAAIGRITGNIYGGSGTFPHGVNTNNGLISGNVYGGLSTNSFGINTNNGTINGVASGNIGKAINTNNAIVSGNIYPAFNQPGISTNSKGALVFGNIYGGNVSNAFGISSNNGVIYGNIYGGSGGGHGVHSNNGTIYGSVTGGLNVTSYGVYQNYNMIIGPLIDSSGVAVSVWTGDFALLDGPNISAVIPSNIKKIYSIGNLSPSASYAGDAVVTTFNGSSNSYITYNDFNGGFRS